MKNRLGKNQSSIGKKHFALQKSEKGDMSCHLKIVGVCQLVALVMVFKEGFSASIERNTHFDISVMEMNRRKDINQWQGWLGGIADRYVRW